jgi:hypothetical protein
MAIALIIVSIFFIAYLSKKANSKNETVVKKDSSYLHLGAGMILIDGEYRKF